MPDLATIYADRVLAAERRQKHPSHGMPHSLQSLGAYLASRNMLAGWAGSEPFAIDAAYLLSLAACPEIVDDGRNFAAAIMEAIAFGEDPMRVSPPSPDRVRYDWLFDALAHSTGVAA